jgi:hypothetical protein
MIPRGRRTAAPFWKGRGITDLRRRHPHETRARISGQGKAREELAVLTTVAELDYRESGVFAVSLLWHRDLEAVSLTIRDRRSCRSLELPVAHDRALQAFKHPFAYAAAIGVDCGNNLT